jgi:nicotinamidase-related amidase
MDDSYVRSAALLSRDDSRLLMIDMQEKLLPAMLHGERVVSNCVKLARGARCLGVPLSGTEQYPRGLGPTVATLAELIDRRPEKLRFSAAQVLDWPGPHADTEGTGARPKVVVAGIEAHVCVLQTVFDLLGAGYDVYVPADAVTSRLELDWRIALERMSAGGAVICTTEGVLFEWCEVAGTDEFKQISRLVTGRE